MPTLFSLYFCQYACFVWWWYEIWMLTARYFQVDEWVRRILFIKAVNTLITSCTRHKSWYSQMRLGWLSLVENSKIIYLECNNTNNSPLKKKTDIQICNKVRKVWYINLKCRNKIDYLLNETSSCHSPMLYSVCV